MMEAFLLDVTAAERDFYGERLIFLEQDEIEKNKGIRIEKFLSLLKE